MKAKQSKARHPPPTTGTSPVPSPPDSGLRSIGRQWSAMVGKGRHAPAGGAALAQPLRTIDVDVTLRHRRHASRDGAICAVRLQPRHLRKRDNPFAVPMRKPALTLLSGASAPATQPTSGASPPAFGSRGRSAVQGFSCTAGRCARRSLTPRCQTSSSTTSDVDAVEGRAHGQERRLLQLCGANPNATPSARRARAQDRKKSSFLRLCLSWSFVRC